MEARYYLTCAWPGLAELWWRGRLSAIPTAVGFALALNLMLVTRYLYPEWMSSGLISMAFWVGVIAWLFYLVRSVRELPQLITPRSVSDQPDRFPEAHAAYLRADWQTAEELLTGVLAIEPRDPPSLLLLTGVYRHTGRLPAAELLLSEIRRLEVADPWWLEVAGEAGRLQRATESENSEEDENGADDQQEPQNGTNPSDPGDHDAADLTAEQTGKAGGRAA